MGLTDMPAPDERGPVEGGAILGVEIPSWLVSARCPAAEPAASSVEASSN